MRVLVTAYSCLPGSGSEPGIGWNWAQCIASNGHEVIVMTRTINRREIETFVEKHPTEPIYFVFHDLPQILQRIYKVPFGNYAYYVLWQYTAASLALKMRDSLSCDRVHHITWGSFRVPSFMGRLGIPFTFGPVGGGEDTPRNLRRGLGWKGRLWDAMRRISSALMSQWMGYTYGSASEIIATTAETMNKIPAKYRHKVRIQLAVGIDVERLLDLRTSLPWKRELRRSSNLELLYVGRLLPWKGLHLVLRALALLDKGHSNFHLAVIGSGGDRTRLQRLSRHLKVDGSISWIPWMPREELIDVYSQFDIFAFPSLHDSGGMAVLEALTFGLPVVCLDLGGPGMLVNKSCGCVIDTKGISEDEVVQAIAQFLADVQEDRGMLHRMSDAARVHAATLTWQANVNSIYSNLLAAQPN